MLRASWLATLLALILSFTSGLSGGGSLGSSDSGKPPSYTQYGSETGAVFGDLNNTVVGKISYNDYLVLARLISAEARGEPYSGQVAVGATVLNRVRNKQFPNTIPGVVFQVVDGYYQYSPVLDGQINLPPSPSAKKAAWAALAGSDPTQGALHFFNPSKTKDRWVHSRQVVKRIGGHLFAI
jgi:spore germination cell wall hydrolase CwlJ-like protein